MTDDIKAGAAATIDPNADAPKPPKTAAATAARAAARAAAQATAAEAGAKPEKTILEKTAANAQGAREAKIAKMKAAKAAINAPPVEPVKVRVTKKGDGQISTGEHIAGLGDLTFDHKEEFVCHPDTARELEERGFVEIQD